MFGLPIEQVQDVFKPSSVTRVPLADAEIAGVLNLRGRIVTAIEMRGRLDAQPRDKAPKRWLSASKPRANPSACWSPRLERCSSSRTVELEPNPINLDRKLAVLSPGVYRLDGQLLVCSGSRAKW